jgi:hypothetical protein
MTDTGQALAMLSAFASVGARVFDLSFTGLDRKPVQGMQRPGRSLEEMRRRIGRDLQDAERERHNVIIRPRSTTALLIQLDDIDDEKAERLQPYSFLTIRTSPGNGQVWLAVSDGPQESDEEAARQFKTRVRRGAAADQSATGATRIAGSLNFKSEYAPAFPRVEITNTNAGSMTTVAALEIAGLIAPRDEPLPPASVHREPLQPARKVAGQGTAPRHWPDYQRTLQGAPMRRDGTGPDRSTADFMWCKWAIERGHSIDETAAKLAEVSERAQEAVRRGDIEKGGVPGYCKLTAWKAAAAVDRERSHRQPMKSSASPG